jgi:hypothetical protein
MRLSLAGPCCASSSSTKCSMTRYATTLSTRVLPIIVGRLYFILRMLKLQLGQVGKDVKHETMCTRFSYISKWSREEKGVPFRVAPKSTEQQPHPSMPRLVQSAGLLPRF